MHTRHKNNIRAIPFSLSPQLCRRERPVAILDGKGKERLVVRRQFDAAHLRGRETPKRGGPYKAYNEPCHVHKPCNPMAASIPSHPTPCTGTRLKDTRSKPSAVSE